jgi:hypothetical protein
VQRRLRASPDATTVLSHASYRFEVGSGQSRARRGGARRCICVACGLRRGGGKACDTVRKRRTPAAWLPMKRVRLRFAAPEFTLMPPPGPAVCVVEQPLMVLSMVVSVLEEKTKKPPPSCHDHARERLCD